MCSQLQRHFQQNRPSLENRCTLLLNLPLAISVKFTITVMLNTSKVNNEQVNIELVKIHQMQKKSNDPIMVRCTSRK